MRRSPLQELPLHHYLPAAPDSKQIRTNKRPLSPGETAFISPAKRRNLTVHDIFSSERTFVSTPTSLRKGFTSPTRFSDMLDSSGSPARILDFGRPKHLAGDPEKCSFSSDVRPATPHQKYSNSQPPRSPELKHQPVRTASPRDSDDVFSGIIPPAILASSSTSDNSFASVPRELPPRTDPLSVHYPGFVVYQDTHIVAFESRPYQSHMMEDDDPDDPKENIPAPFPVARNVPTPRAHKAAFDDDRSLERLKFKPPSSPRKSRRDTVDSLSLLTLSRHLDTASSGRRNINISRRILQDELDLGEESDEVD